MITVVCLEPETAGNLGAIARAMKNFDAEKLLLINPRCDHLSKEALDRATKAKSILQRAIVKKDISCLSEFDYVIGTTAKIGRDYNVNRVPITPKELAKNITATNIAATKKVALLFGREGAGLNNKEVTACDCIVTIPAAAKYPTMNISHAVAIILYELSSTSSMPSSPKVGETITRAAKREKDQIMKLLEVVLVNMAFPTEGKRETQRKVWKRLVGKSFLTKREAYALMGFLAKVKEEMGKGKR